MGTAYALMGTFLETQAMEVIETLSRSAPPNWNERSTHVSDLLKDLARVRNQPIRRETFRRWRRKAAIDHSRRKWYSFNDFLRLAIIAKHLFDGGGIEDEELDILLLEQIENEAS